jgi:hypothetical protein
MSGRLALTCESFTAFLFALVPAGPSVPLA